MQTVCETLLEWTASAAIYNPVNLDVVAGNYVNLYPEQLQPLSLFIFEQQDVVKSKNALTELKEWILLQEFYHFNRELAMNKVQIIVGACSDIIANKYSITFNDEQKQIASSIIIDEGFHSLSCFSINDQLVKLNDINFVSLAVTTNSIEEIVLNCNELLEPSFRNDFQLVVACLLKTAMVKEVELGIKLVEGLEQSEMSYYKLQKNRQHDEVRHGCFFLLALELLWAKLPAANKGKLMPAIQLFTELYRQLILSGNPEFVARLLRPLSVDRSMLDNAMEHTKNYRSEYAASIYETMLNLLNQSKVLH